GHIRQFGNDDFLLLKIQCHCLPSELEPERRVMRLPIRIPTNPVSWGPAGVNDAELVAVRKHPHGHHHLRRLVSLPIKVLRRSPLAPAMRVASMPRRATTCGL